MRALALAAIVAVYARMRRRASITSDRWKPLIRRMAAPQTDDPLPKFQPSGRAVTAWHTEALAQTRKEK
jgi:hypothetical protein